MGRDYVLLQLKLKGQGPFDFMVRPPRLRSRDVHQALTICSQFAANLHCMPLLLRAPAEFHLGQTSAPWYMQSHMFPTLLSFPLSLLLLFAFELPLHSPMQERAGTQACLAPPEPCCRWTPG